MKKNIFSKLISSANNLTATVYWNSNNAARMRGTEGEEPSVESQFSGSSESEIVRDILDEIFGIDSDEWIEDYEYSLTINDLIDYADGIDIGGGWPIIFWIDFNGKRYETSWDESEFEVEEDYDDNNDEFDDTPYDDTTSELRKIVQKYLKNYHTTSQVDKIFCYEWLEGWKAEVYPRLTSPVNKKVLKYYLLESKYFKGHNLDINTYAESDKYGKYTNIVITDKDK